MTPRPSLPGSLLPWTIAAGFAFAAIWLAQRYHSTRTEAALLRTEQEFLDVALQTARQQLEAERLLSSRAVVELNTDLATQSEKLAAAERALAEVRPRTAAPNADATLDSGLGTLGITTLSSTLNNSPAALAVAVWDPATQAGVLQVEKLPTLADDETYQLWVVDPQYPTPVDAGVFTVDASTGAARLTFKPRQAIRAINAFTVTRERKTGTATTQGPVVLRGTPHP